MRICVFCSSSESVDGVYTEEAQELGLLIAAGGHSLVYGGGGYGLMGAIARAVRTNGGDVTGIIPEFMVERKYDGASRTIVTRDMRERKARMQEMSDAFIALPGGFGTLEEILEIITLSQLGIVRKPIVLMNTSDFWSGLQSVFDRLYAEKFAKAAYRSLYHIAAGPSETMSYILDWKPGEQVKKWS
jgi:uncharacterized protein (TIGR00730 family)